MTTHFYYPDRELQDELSCIAKGLVAPGKGILAVDETSSQMGKRLELIGVENTEENRRLYRQILFTTDAKIAENISGVIFPPEALHQKTDDSVPFAEVLRKKGILTGIKVDKQFVALFGSEDEFTTQGLDDLAARCSQYKKEGCSFAKWRCVLKISKNTPSHQAILENANVLARYAATCQSQGLVPIINPDILAVGDHDLDRCQKVAETVLAAVYKSLNDHHIFLEGTLLQPSIVTPGMQSQKSTLPADIGLCTVLAIRRTVPPAVPGVMFCSGNQSEEEATVNLNAINNVPLCKPWAMTFAFDRALQSSVLRTWGGRKDNVVNAQNELIKRCKANSLASIGKYIPGSVEGSAGTEKLIFDALEY
ncbi:fructose-bisphosphate aldolase-like [Drosophila pseudoobscura]|uniref:Fructose-bisphosphate aldolase n=1 Tax=Drosophila pseudoobscura pseudoobscura TaxID=46245 RepID=A0A6I8UQK1_DROPS|nr:fructose-bisphosphate aldolase [Drosophila pseudoobscura]